MKSFIKTIVSFGVVAILFSGAPTAHAWVDDFGYGYDSYDSYGGSWSDAGYGCADCWVDDFSYSGDYWVDDFDYSGDYWVDDFNYYGDEWVDDFTYTGDYWVDDFDYSGYYETYDPGYYEVYDPGYYQVEEELGYFGYSSGGSGGYYGGYYGGGYSYPSYSKPQYHNVSSYYNSNTNVNNITNTNINQNTNTNIDNSVYMNNVGNTNIAIAQTQPVVQHALPSCTMSITHTNYGYATLNWTTYNATSATVNNGIGSVTTGSGSRSIYVGTGYAYTMTVYNGYGESAVCTANQTYVNPNVTVSVSQIPYTGIDSWGYVLMLIALSLGAGVAFFFYRGEIAMATRSVFAKSEEEATPEVAETAQEDEEEVAQPAGDSLTLEKTADGPKLSFSRA